MGTGLEVGTSKDRVVLLLRNQGFAMEFGAATARALAKSLEEAADQAEDFEEDDE